MQLITQRWERVHSKVNLNQVVRVEESSGEEQGLLSTGARRAEHGRVGVYVMLGDLEVVWAQAVPDTMKLNLWIKHSARVNY